MVAFTVAATLALPAHAQVAGQRLGACPERVYLSIDQIVVATAMATVLDELDTQFAGLRGDGQIVAGMMQCARKLPYFTCTDKMLFGLLDPRDAAIGGAAGIAVDGIRGQPSLIGGLLGAGVVGMTSCVVQVGACNKRFPSLKPAVVAAFGGWQFDVGQFDVDQVRGSEVRDRVARAARSGRISAADAQALLKFVNGASEQLTK